MDLQRATTALLRAATLLVLAAVTAFVVATGVAALRADVYEARALVDVEQLVDDDDDAFSNTERADRTVANELVVAQDPEVARVASQRLGTDADVLGAAVSIEQLTGTDSIAFSASAADAPAAALRATSYATSYAAVRLDRQRSALREQAESITRQLTSLQEQLALPSTTGSSERQVRNDALREPYADLVVQQLELQGRADSQQDPEQAVLAAPLPTGPAGPGPVLWGVLASVLAGSLGAVLVVALHRRRDPVEYRSDLEDLPVPVLAELGPDNRPVIIGGKSPLGEAAVELLVRAHRPCVVAVVSIDDRTPDLVSQLGDAMRAQGCHVVRASSLAQRHPEVHGTADPIIVLQTSTTSADLRSLSRADVVLVVVSVGVTRRADLARTLKLLERASQATCLAVLVHGVSRPVRPPRRAELEDDERVEPDGPAAAGRRTIQLKARSGS